MVDKINKIDDDKVELEQTDSIKNVFTKEQLLINKSKVEKSLQQINDMLNLLK